MGVRYRNNEEELFKVGMYLRLSQEDKFKKNIESNSIENQRKIIKDYINKSNDLVYIEVVEDSISEILRVLELFPIEKLFAVALKEVVWLYLFEEIVVLQEKSNK